MVVSLIVERCGSNQDQRTATTVIKDGLLPLAVRREDLHYYDVHSATPTYAINNFISHGEMYSHSGLFVNL